jgi:hypothetical protein
MAADPADQTRRGSLPISLRLTSHALSNKAAALDLWVTAALFGTAFPDWALEAIESQGTFPESLRTRLIRNHVLVRSEGRFTMLPPVSSHALQRAVLEQHGFSWRRARVHALAFFLSLAKQVNSIASTELPLTARQRLVPKVLRDCCTASVLAPRRLLQP